MELVHGLHNLRDKHRGCVLTIGKFDGVHLGHKAVLSQLIEQARQRNFRRQLWCLNRSQKKCFFRTLRLHG